MDKVVSIFADGRLHRRLLDRIVGLELTSLNGRLVLRLTTTSDVRYDWLIYHVNFRFIVNGGERTIEGKCWGVHHNADDLLTTHDAVIEFHDPETGRSRTLGEWKTLEIVLMAGKEEKGFGVKKEEKTEVKKTS